MNDVPSPESQRLMEAVDHAIQGTAYRVLPTQDGFSLGIDIDAEKWWHLLAQRQLPYVYTHHVRFPEPGRYAISDSSYELVWSAGVPSVSEAVPWDSGRMAHHWWNKLNETPHADLEDEATHTFSLQEGRRIVTQEADRLGLRLAWDNHLVVGITAAGLAVVGAMAAAVIAILT